MSKILTNKEVDHHQRACLLKRYVISVLLSSRRRILDTTVQSAMKKKLDAFELWIYRDILRIPWTGPE